MENPQFFSNILGGCCSNFITYNLLCFLSVYTWNLASYAYFKEVFSEVQWPHSLFAWFCFKLCQSVLSHNLKSSFSYLFKISRTFLKTSFLWSLELNTVLQYLFHQWLQHNNNVTLLLLHTMFLLQQLFGKQLCSAVTKQNDGDSPDSCKRELLYCKNQAFLSS